MLYSPTKGVKQRYIPYISGLVAYRQYIHNCSSSVDPSWLTAVSQLSAPPLSWACLHSPGLVSTTALKAWYRTWASSLGPGLAYLYGTFGCMVGKQVGQYSDSDRVSHLRQSLPSGDRRPGVISVWWGEGEGEPSTSWEERSLAQRLWSLCGD